MQRMDKNGKENYAKDQNWKIKCKGGPKLKKIMLKGQN